MDFKVGGGEVEEGEGGRAWNTEKYCRPEKKKKNFRDKKNSEF